MVELEPPDPARRHRSSLAPLQAAIAAVHSEATRAEDTDWPQILALYLAGEEDQARETFREAARVATSTPEQRYVERRGAVVDEEA